MKKQYIAPEIEVIECAGNAAILAGSDITSDSGGYGDGGSSGMDEDFSGAKSNDWSIWE
ncbi:MAG: hypothetical protein SPF12_05345 [Prevotella sp.]|nr:hypothetical protein [Prevotella sp.]